MSKTRAFYNRHKQMILYLAFGLVTTVASLVACYLTLTIGVKFIHDENGEPTELLDILGSTTQWIVGVLVAFFTNKKWVFTEAAHGKKTTLIQLAEFSGGRVATYVAEVLINLGAIAALEALHYQEFVFLGVPFTVRTWAKILSLIFVGVSNYFISKLFVFRK